MHERLQKQCCTGPLMKTEIKINHTSPRGTVWRDIKQKDMTWETFISRQWTEKNGSYGLSDMQVKWRTTVYCWHTCCNNEIRDILHDTAIRQPDSDSDTDVSLSLRHCHHSFHKMLHSHQRQHTWQISEQKLTHQKTTSSTATISSTVLRKTQQAMKQTSLAMFSFCYLLTNQ